MMRYTTKDYEGTVSGEAFELAPIVRSVRAGGYTLPPVTVAGRVSADGPGATIEARVRPALRRTAVQVTGLVVIVVTTVLAIVTFSDAPPSLGVVFPFLFALLTTYAVMMFSLAEEVKRARAFLEELANHRAS